MKQQLKLILLSGAMIIGAQTAQAQTCATQPSCSELGYTLTSTTDCIGTVLKCPFDKSKYYCTTKTEALNKLKADIVTAGMPDYNKPKSLSNGGNYTVGVGVLAGYSCGWVLFSNATNQMNRYGNDVLWKINNKEVGIGIYNMEANSNTMIVPVKKNDIIEISGGAYYCKFIFYPCMGLN